MNVCDNCKKNPASRRFVIGMTPLESPVLAASYFDLCNACLPLPYGAVLQALPGIEDPMGFPHTAAGVELIGPAPSPSKMSTEELAEAFLSLSGKPRPTS